MKNWTQKMLNPLKIEKKEFNVVGFADFEGIFNEIYGAEFNICETLGVGNDCYVDYTIKKGDVSQDELDWALNQLKKLGEYEQATLYDALVTDAANKDLIPEGEYLIRISW